ncbi:MAG: tRNA pseudouridine(38-40) synthase TruA [Crocinitomicaceae bacterium]|nr:tRNA pseudouridine(38-40) synthase TruA [Crocinitomicaceae bacterium]
MKRYYFEVAYDGSLFCGWQVQPEQVTVQQVIEEALTKINSNTPVFIVGCGRTDTGVHAKCSVFHTDMDLKIDVETLQFRLNKILPHSISILTIRETDDNFHARFSAKKRTYRYFIHTQKNPFKHSYSTLLEAELDMDKLNEASRLLLDTHDFTTFSKAKSDVKTHICTVFKAEWTKTEEGYQFEYAANRFLRNMVRATVGTLLLVGQNKITIEEFKAIFDSMDRNRCATSAPAQGLFLWKVEY